jgi:hypothetical protein
MGFPLNMVCTAACSPCAYASVSGVSAETASQAYYGCLLFYVGCTVDADMASDIFEDGALLAHFAPAMFGSRAQALAGILRPLAGPGSPAPMGMIRAAGRLPRAHGGQCSSTMLAAWPSRRAYG